MAIVTVASMATVGVSWADRPVAAAGFGAWILVLARLSVVDLTERRLPNRIVGPATVAVLAWLVVATTLDGDPARLARAFGAAVGASALLLALSLLGPLGMGDVKLAFPVGMVAGWLGADAARATVATTAVSGALVAGVLVARGRGRETLPYGPFLALGSVAGILVAGAAGAP